MAEDRADPVKMSKVQILRCLVKQRLSAAAEQIFELFERTIAEYEEEISRSKEEKEKPQEAGLNPEGDSRGPDIRQQQERNSGLNQENPQQSQILKEEEDRPWISVDRGQHQDLEEADIDMFILSTVPKESDDEDRGEPQSIQLDEDQSEENGDTEHLKTTDGEDFGGSECPDVKQQQERNSGPNQENPLVSLTIKIEEDRPWINMKRGREETDMRMFTFSAVSVKSDDEDRGEPQPFQLDEGQSEENRDTEHLKTEADGENCGGPEPDADFDPHGPLQPVSPAGTSDPTGSDTEDSSDWNESDEPQEGSNPVPSKDEAVSDMKHRTGDTPVSSSKCAPSFGRKKQQQKRKRRKRAKRFRCSICKNSFTSKKSLRQHILHHSKETPFSCSFCSKGFNRKTQLQSHMIFHTGEKPFACSVCGKKYPRKRNLQIHLQRHAVEKPYSCSICKKGFIRKTEMETHMRTHTRETPFVCSVCGKTFIHQGNLNKHAIVHGRKRQHICSVCGKEFTTRGLLDRHSVVHSGETSFSCPVCAKAFTYQKSFMKHKCNGRRCEIK